MILTLGLALAALCAAVLALLRQRRDRTVYLRMSDAWVRDHRADALPDHLR